MHSDIEEEISETGEAEMTQRSSEAAVCVYTCVCVWWTKLAFLFPVYKSSTYLLCLYIKSLFGLVSK